MADITSTLESLYSQRDFLVQRKESLDGRTSSLAQTLLKKTQSELDAKNQEISLAEKKKAELQIALDQNEKAISDRENNTVLYIQEQSKLIVLEFLRYLKTHSEEIGIELKKTYRIMEVLEYENDRYGGCYTPTGHVGIYDISTKTFIAKSKDFYFKNLLCTYERGELDELHCHFTGWYKEYRSRFISEIIETLKKDYYYYSYDETFSLTITDSEFTLELV